MHDHGKSPLAADRQIIPRSKHMNYQWQRAVGFMGKVAGGSRVQVPAGRLHTGKARDTPRHYRTRLHRLWIRSSASVTKPSLLQCTFQSRERDAHYRPRRGGKGGDKNNIQSSIQQIAAQEKKQRQQGGISRGQVQARGSHCWLAAAARHLRTTICMAGRGSQAATFAWIP